MMLTKTHRLRSSTRIQHVKSNGRSWHNRWLVLIKCANATGTSRFAFSVSRRVGKAVVRNQLKRRLSEVIRQQLSLIRGGWDVLLIARLPLKEATYNQIEHAILDLLRRSGLLLQTMSSKAPSPMGEEVASSAESSSGGIRRPPTEELTMSAWPH